MGSELLSPTEEEIGDECYRRVTVGCEPVDNFWLEFGEGVDEGVVSSVADLTDVLCASGDVRVGREWEN